MFIEYAINHVFLPPKLPQADDRNFGYDGELAKSLRHSLREFRALEPDSDAALKGAIDLFDRYAQLRDSVEHAQDWIANLKDGGMYSLANSTVITVCVLIR